MTITAEQKKLQQLQMIRKERDLQIQQKETLENTLAYVELCIQQRTDDMAEIEKELVDAANAGVPRREAADKLTRQFGQPYTPRAGDLVDIACEGPEIWGLILAAKPLLGWATILKPDSRRVTYDFSLLTRVINSTPEQVKFYLHHVHQIETEPESNQSEMQQVPTPHVREQTVGVSEGEGHGSTQTDDDFHGHPGLLRGQCSSSLRITPTSIASVPAGVDVYTYLGGSTGLYPAVSYGGEFANHESWSGCSH